jgi:hypothetical protein
MNSVLYTVLFTALACVCIFIGINPDSAYYQQAFLIFGGFCLGGMAICIIESLDS